MKRAIVWLLTLALLGAAGYFGYRWYDDHQSPAASYRTQPVRKTDIAQTIPASGTVVPEDVVDIGAQVNGQIAEFGKDADGKPIDYRSTIQEGMMLAKIDDALYAADLASARAQRTSAEAQIAQADAQVGQAEAQIRVGEANRQLARAKLEQARRDWERAQKLIGSTALSRADYDAAQSAFEQAQAGVAVAEASIAQAQAARAQAAASKSQAQAAVSLADASIQRATRNLTYCVIKSPVSGVVIDKRVEIGQTVVASLNAPSLFLLAKDLGKMQVLVQVNEANIGNVHPGQKVVFTVDAFPGKRFRGEVRKVRLNAAMTQNVVTYTVEIATDNADLKLLPYLTANVRFDIAHKESVLAVPNAALRWAPRGTDTPETAPSAARAGKGEGESGLRPGTVWILKDGRPLALAVKAGLSDSVLTEVEGESLAEGLEVIVGERSSDQSAAASTTNPFAPPMMGRGTRPTGQGGGGGGGGGTRGGGR
jgi:HlyD family secretion protein